MSGPTIIRTVTRALVSMLDGGVTATVKALPLEKVKAVTEPTLIVYLYQVLESPTLKNSGPRTTGLTGGGPGAQTVAVERDPLALDLYYLIVPAVQDEESAFLETYTMLGEAARVLHDRASFAIGEFVSDEPLDAKVQLRITMNPLTTSQLFELWEAVNEPYRLSVSYVVRTVRIDSALKTDGTVWCAGKNDYFQLGNPTITSGSSSQMTQVVGLCLGADGASVGRCNSISVSPKPRDAEVEVFEGTVLGHVVIEDGHRAAMGDGIGGIAFAQRPVPITRACPDFALCYRSGHRSTKRSWTLGDGSKRKTQRRKARSEGLLLE